MLAALATAATRHPRRMVLLGTAVFVLAGVFGATAVGLLNARNPFSDPSSGGRCCSAPRRWPPRWRA